MGSVYSTADAPDVIVDDELLHSEEKEIQTIQNNKNTIHTKKPQDYIYALSVDDNVECFSTNRKNIEKTVEFYKNKISMSSFISNEILYSEIADKDTVRMYTRTIGQPLYNKDKLISVLKIIKVPYYLSKILGAK